MLEGSYRLEVDDGRMIFVRPDVTMTRGRHVALMKSERALRAIYLNRDHTIRGADAEALIESGHAELLGERLQDQPALGERIADIEHASEADFVAGFLREHEVEGVGIEFGCSYGGLIRGLWAKGLTIDGVDDSEVAIRHLADRCDRSARGGSRLFVGGLGEFSAPNDYAFAVSGFGAVQRMRNSAMMIRHLHLAALSVAENAHYLVRIDLGAEESNCGPDESGVSLRTEMIFESPPSRLWLQRMEVLDGHRMELSHTLRVRSFRQVSEWTDLFNGSGEWECESVLRCQDSSVQSCDPRGAGISGIVWYVLRRTSFTGDTMFGGT